jgi:hypothetical protein
VLRVIPLLLAAAIASAGCNSILGIDDHSLGPQESGDKGGSDAASAVESGPGNIGQDAPGVTDSNANAGDADGSSDTGRDVATGDSGMPESGPGDIGQDAPGVTDSNANAGDADGSSDTGWDVAAGDSGTPADAASEAHLESGVAATTDNAPTKDAYVRDGAYATTNFGTDVALGIKSSATDFSRRTWLTFDISDFASITTAKLRLFVTSLDNSATNAISANVFSTPATSNGWGELTITWNNAPAIGQQIASNSVDTPNVGTWVEWDVTSAVQTEIGGTSTLVIDAQAGSFRGVFFSSREGPYPPVLRITGY